MSAPMTVLDEETQRALKKRAEQHGVTQEELVQALVRAYLQYSSSNLGVPRHADMLTRESPPSPPSAAMEPHERVRVDVRAAIDAVVRENEKGLRYLAGR